jgi:ferredoxin-type protein NapG
MRPPGAVDEKHFMALCIRCNRCLEVCPYGSIKRAGLGLTMGTPYVLAEQKACYLCMACSRLCPTGALDNELVAPEKAAMGRAVIPDQTGRQIGAVCNTCYNVCPLQDKAIVLRKNLCPEILDACVGCGICVERCPTRPRRAVNIVPTGMGRVDEAGFYFRKAKGHHESAQSPAQSPAGVLKGEQLLEQKSRIEGTKELPKFDFPYETPKKIEGWD